EQKLREMATGVGIRLPHPIQAAPGGPRRTKLPPGPTQFTTEKAGLTDGIWITGCAPKRSSRANLKMAEHKAARRPRALRTPNREAPGEPRAFESSRGLESNRSHRLRSEERRVGKEGRSG